MSQLKHFIHWYFFVLTSFAILSNVKTAWSSDWSSEKICEVARQNHKAEYQYKFERLLKKEPNLNKIDCNLFELLYSSFKRSGFISDIRKSRFDNIVLLIENGYDVNRANVNGDTPLHRAIYKQDLNLINYLINNGADVNALNNYGKSPLSTAVSYASSVEINALLHIATNFETASKAMEEAIKERKIEIVEIFLQHGINPSHEIMEKAEEFAKEGSYERKKALQIVALLKKYRELRATAISRGQNPSSLSFNPPPFQLQLLPPKHNPPLIEAILQNNTNEVKKLIFKGANPNTVSKSASTALNMAIGSCNLEIAKILIRGGASLTLRNSSGYHPLSLATINNNLNLVRFLIDSGAPVDLETAREKNTALNISNNVEISELLLDKGADLNHQSILGFTPLFNAIKNQNILLVKFYLDKGADVNLAKKNRETPLIFAIRSNQHKVVQLLLPYVTDSQKLEAYNFAKLFGSKKIINEFEQAHVRTIDNKELFDRAVQSKNIKLIRQLLTPEIKAYLKSDCGSLNLLNLIDDGGNILEVAKILIENGANVNVVALENNKIIKTPLLSAIDSSLIENPIDLIQLFIKNGANLDVKTYNGLTPLSAAIDRINFIHNFEGEEPPENIELRLDIDEYVKYRNEYYNKQIDEELKRLANESIKIVELLLMAKTNSERNIQDHAVKKQISSLKQNKNKIISEYGKRLDLLIEQY